MFKIGLTGLKGALNQKEAPPKGKGAKNSNPWGNGGPKIPGKKRRGTPKKGGN